ncbi:MAG: gamma-glutamyltransferase [SAR202 cluster bacterium]|nr:gamma-glutamyltransferase [SAR202 cluster bacterium]
MTNKSYWTPGRDEVEAANGMVTAMEAPAAEAGLEILKKGGNAVDAAVAIGFCNVVLEPFMATIGGMGYMLIHLAEEGKTVAIDFNGRAPRNARPDMYNVTGPAEPGGYHIFDVEGDAHSVGPQCVTVPGTCAGLCEAHRLYGTLPLEQLLEPAIHFATEGFEADWHVTLYAANDWEHLTLDPYLASMWLPGGHPPRSYAGSGDKIVQKDLGELLKKIAKHGPDAMYRGEVADAIDKFMRKEGGILTKQDLADYQPIVAEPMSVPFKGHTIMGVPTPSGCLTNLQAFRILDRFDLDAVGHNTVDYVNLFIQVARHTFADRYRYLGDWEHVPVPLQGLLSSEYNRELARRVNLRTAGIAAYHEDEPWVHYLDEAAHDPWSYDPAGAPAEMFHPASDTNDEATTHFNVVDRWRNAVTCTHTGVFTAGANPPSTGVYLVGGMAWFIPKPGYANSIAGWKRPLNNQSPLMVFRDGRPILCQGAPGARRIMNRGVQVVTNVIVFGMGPQEAISQPTVDASGRETLINARMPDDVVGGLRRLGHRVEVVEETPSLTGAFSRPSAITIDYEEGLLRAGVDSYRPTMAIGY